MNNCDLILFNKELHSLELVQLIRLVKKNGHRSIQEIYNLIRDRLKSDETPISFGIESKSKKYINSILELQQALLTSLKPIFTTIKGRDGFANFETLVENSFLSDAGIATGSVKGDTDPEAPAMENNPDMPNEEERTSRSVNNLVSTYYGTVIKANEARKRQFGLDLVRSCIINIENKTIVRTNLDLNKQMCFLQEKYFQNIIRYLKKVDPNFKYEANLFDENLELITGYEQVLNNFYNRLKKLKNTETLITEGWKKSLFGINDLFYEALNSYVNLEYFDEILEDSVGKVIQLTDDSYKGIKLGAAYGKYKFSKGDEHKRKGFQNSENRDALKDIARFSKLIINTIPVYSTTENKFLNRYLDIGTFASAITTLFTAVPSLGNNFLKFQEAVVDFHSNPYYYSTIIFSEIANNSNLQTSLIQAGVNMFHINTLTSIYKYVYDTNNQSSIKSIETAAMKRQFSVDSYSIIDTLNGVIDRTMDATYLQMIYSGKSQNVVVSTKKKFKSRQSSYRIINAINARIIQMKDQTRSELAKQFPVSKYDVRTKNLDSAGKSYSIKLFGGSIIGTNKRGVLSAKPMTLEFTNSRMKELLKGTNTAIDLISTESIDRLISGTNLSNDEQMFRSILEFIDAFLDLDLLSRDGLDKLCYYKATNQLSNNYLSDMLQSAIRAAVVNDIYYKFSKQLGTEKYPTRKSFAEFSKTEYTPFATINLQNYEEAQQYIINKIGVPELVSVRVSDQWIDQFTFAEDVLTGKVSKSTTKDIEGNSIANNRTSFLGGNIRYYLSKYQKSGQDTATSPLLFTKDSSLITSTVFNTDAQSRVGIKKNVRKMGAGELLYSSIVFGFYSNYLQSSWDERHDKKDNKLRGSVLVQPTTYSDKVSFVTYGIDANKKLKAEGKSYNDKTIWQLNKNKLLDLYIDTIGKAYQNLYNNVLDDLRVILDLDPNADFETINRVLTSTRIHTTTINGVVVEGIIDKAAKKGLEVQLDTHYRKNGEYCKFNELLQYYATDLYANKERLAERFKREELEFVNDLLEAGVSFYTYYGDDSEQDILSKKTQNPIQKIIKSFPNFDQSKWVKHNKLVLAIVDGEPIYKGAKIKEGAKTIELNPILEKYFYTDSLLGNNLRLELTGTEVAHPDKAKIDYKTELYKLGITEETHPQYFTEKGDVISSFKDLTWVRTQPELTQLYYNVIVNIEATGQGTQLKRNVIIPATLQYEQQNTLTGIPPQMKVAVIEDTKASIFNFRGDSSTEDAHDGSAYINPFVSILENKSLQDQEVGVDKKPIWHSYNSRLMSATLLKFATFTMTNERLKTSLNSDISLYNLFKQMTNIQWQNPDGTWNTRNGQEINLITTKGFKRNGSKIDFFYDVLQENPLYYNENGNHYQITDFKQDENGFYYTVETPVNFLGSRKGEDIKVYHAFDNEGHHFKFRNSVPPTNLHKINSLFELYNALGGIYSESLVEDENGIKSLKESDSSSYAVVGFMNNVSMRVTNDTSDLSQRTYYQPLKDMMIAYAANSSAVKNGASNINSREAWKGGMKLKYMTLDTDGLGIQMDADHEIDEAEMTEFTQVISALEAGGRLHPLTKQVYQALGQLALQASSLEINAVSNYIAAKSKGQDLTRVKNKIYTIFGRTLINNYKPNSEYTDLAAPIIEEIKKTFALTEDHTLDSFKLPFSDSSVYKHAIQTFVSSINSKAIKRKYPGSGCVMVPGYKIIQTYKYDGKILMFDDVLKEAKSANFFRPFNAANEDIVTYNRALVQEYLKRKQELLYSSPRNVEEFIPTDIIDVLVDGKYVGTVDTEDVHTYYDLTTNPTQYVLDHYGKTGVITFATNITKPRSLAPARVQWSYKDEYGIPHTTNIFNLAPVREAFLEGKDNREIIQNIFNQLENGTYLEQGKYQIFNLINEPAEQVISNPYASKFDIKGKSVAEILANPNFFKVRKVNQIRSKNYELAFTNNNGRHTYISLRVPKTNIDDDAYAPKNIGWKYTTTIAEGDRENVYATTKDGQRLYKVGQNIPTRYKYVNGSIIDPENNNIEVENPNLKVNSRGQVVEYKEFISNYKVSEKGKNGRLITYNLFVVNVANIFSALHNPSEDTVNGQIAKILKDIYETDSYNGFRLNYTMSGRSADRLSKILPKLKSNDEDSEQNSFDKLIDLTVSKYLTGIDTNVQFNIDMNSYNSDLTEYYNQFANEIFTSFQKSLYFTASRIPAQTLQSFMQSKTVGFTQSSKNIVYVSHWQTWLQGSDYDIDKAYIMGYEFDDNGRYIGWSNLFNYSTIETLQASEYLPMPDLVNYRKSDTGINISNYIELLKQTTDPALIQRIYANMLTELQDTEYIVEGNKRYRDVTWDIDDDFAQKVLKKLNIHSLTKISPIKMQKCLKNFVSSRITNIIQNLKNMDQAYSPIVMSAMQKAAEQSTKGSKASRMSLLNPATKYLMQEQNMVGKDVIGIAAVGEKVFFNASYYWNEGIRSGNEQWIKNLQFSQTFNRIQGRASGIISSIQKTKIANVNFDEIEEMRLKFEFANDIDDNLREKYGITDFDIINKTDKWKVYRDELFETVRKKQDNGGYADDIISQLLSAATDNAKELILSKINAGSDLAGCYLHLIMMGFSIYDITSFMISPAVSNVHSLATSNMFDNYRFNISVKNAINILRGDMPISTFFNGKINTPLGKRSQYSIAFSNIKKDLQKELFNLGYKAPGSDDKKPDYKSFKDIIKHYFDARIKGQITKSLVEYSSISNVAVKNSMYAFSDFIDTVVDMSLSHNQSLDEYLADLNEFDKVYRLAQETSTLGNVFLGFNQGIAPTKEDIYSKILQIERTVSNRESELGINSTSISNPETLQTVIDGILENNPFLTYDEVAQTLNDASDIINNFNFYKWLIDENGYRELTARYYNILKGTWNIFDMIDKLPHFNAIFQNLKAVIISDQVSIKKSQLLEVICKDLFNEHSIVDSTMINSLLDYIDDLLVLRWLKEKQIQFPVFEGQTIFKFDWSSYEHKGDPATITLDSEANRSTFKKFIEEELLPTLKEGYYYDIDENGNKVRREIDQNNQFIKNLKIDIDNNDQPYLRLNIDMQNTSSTPSNEAKYQQSLSDFTKLKNEKIAGMSISNWFMIYNLLLNKTKTGADRLTSLFIQFIELNPEESIIKEYLQYLGEVDQNTVDETLESLKEYGYNRDDALFRIAPITSKSQEVNCKAEMIKQEVNGRMIIKRKEPNGYSDGEELISVDTSLQDLNTRLQNYIKYSVLQTPFANKTSIISTNLQSNDAELILNALQNYMKLGIIEITTKNC